MARAIVEPRLGASLETSAGAFFPDRVTFQAATDARDSVGENISTWANVPGMVEVPARIAPEARLSRDEEIRQPDQIMEDLRRRVGLPASYSIDLRWRMLDANTGEVYDIIRIDSGTITFLTVELRR